MPRELLKEKGKRKLSKETEKKILLIMKILGYVIPASFMATFTLLAFFTNNIAVSGVLIGVGVVLTIGTFAMMRKIISGVEVSE